MWPNPSYRSVLREFDDRCVCDPEWPDLCFADDDQAVIITDPFSPSEVVDGGVHGLHEDSKIRVTAYHRDPDKRGDELGVGRQRFHQRVDVSDC